MPPARPLPNRSPSYPNQPFANSPLSSYITPSNPIPSNANLIPSPTRTPSYNTSPSPIHTKSPTSPSNALHPKTHTSGLLLWTPLTTTLHIIWFSQFIVSLITEYGICGTDLLSDVARVRSVEWLSVPLTTLNTLVILCIVIETCLYVNHGMNSGLYLLFQILKSAYMVTIYIFVLTRCGIVQENDLWTLVWGSVVFLTPWVSAVVLGIWIKVKEVKRRKGLSRKGKDVDISPVDEERPLLG